MNKRELPVLIALLLILASCGERESVIMDTDLTQPQVITIPVGNDQSSSCEITTIEDNYFAVTCNGQTIQVHGEVLSYTDMKDDLITVIASHKSSSESGESYYDAFINLMVPLTLNLPHFIPSVVAGQVGQRLYVLFNDNILCVWIADDSGSYTDRECRKDPELSHGGENPIEGGEIIDDSSQLEDVGSIMMRVYNGPSTDGSLQTTTATAIFEISPDLVADP